MIRIRYKDLSSGLHGKAEHCGNGVTVYLLPGLTGSQRKAALRRLRQEASRGCGPALPGSQLAVALGWDRVRTAFGSVAAVVRHHPAASFLNATVVGSLMTLFVLASVSIAPGSQAVSGGAAAGSGSPAPVAFSPPVHAAPGPEGPGGRRETLWWLAATSGSWAVGKGFRAGVGPAPGALIRTTIGAPSP